MSKLRRSYYQNEDVVGLASNLLGKVLVTKLNGALTSGIIIETEAYAGVNDKASHAYGGRCTRRTEVMYSNGGTAYVYLCYGIHHLFNVVTNKVGVPHAVLIRGIEPLDGIDTILRRRNKRCIDKTTSAGPGTVSQALGITTALTGTYLTGNCIWIEDRAIEVKKNSITVGPRVGVDYAGNDALLHYRFTTFFS